MKKHVISFVIKANTKWFIKIKLMVYFIRGIIKMTANQKAIKKAPGWTLNIQM